MDLLNFDRNDSGTFWIISKVRGLSQKTQEMYFTAMASFFEYLEYEGYVDKNPVNSVRKRYLRRYKDNDDGQSRKLISVEEMTKLINSTLDVRDKAIIALLAKTGIRRNELITLDIDDIDWIGQSIRLKPTAKRTNRTVFFDDETAIILHRWVRARETRNSEDSKALFLNNLWAPKSEWCIFSGDSACGENRSAQSRIRTHGGSFLASLLQTLVYNSFAKSWHAS